jgi:hypothetical protein
MKYWGDFMEGVSGKSWGELRKICVLSFIERILVCAVGVCNPSNQNIIKSIM